MDPILDTLYSKQVTRNHHVQQTIDVSNSPKSGLMCLYFVTAGSVAVNISPQARVRSSVCRKIVSQPPIQSRDHGM